MIRPPKKYSASHVYAKFAKNKRVSKPIAAQDSAERLLRKHQEGALTSEQLQASLPKYLVAAIDFVTGNDEKEVSPGEGAPVND